MRLSYTTFAYSGLSLAASGKTVLTVTYTIANTGTRGGKEASQVYVTLPAEAYEPSKRLAGFKKINLKPGESQQVSVTIDCSASNHPFSYFKPADESNLEAWANGDWVTPSGQFLIDVGPSSTQVPLQAPVDLDLAGC
jgi:beta-glucosidase